MSATPAARGAIAGLPADVVDGLVAIAADEKAHEALVAAARSCRHCAEPIRLTGRSATIDAGSGEVVESFASSDVPGGEVLKACGTRRATRCPSCAAIYQGDARALVRAGLVGGKGTDPSVAGHSMVFATLTAPSFGAVHRRPGPGGPCHARRPGRCAHGRAVSCLAHHGVDDPMLGAPICPECHDTEAAVLFNASQSELWRRTAIYTRRQLARLAGTTARELEALVRLSYVKVAELQRRGVVHLHVILRLDGRDGCPPPAEITASMLALALRIAASQVRVPYHDGRGEAAWGDQLDCTPLDASSPERVRKVANYLAKYATKGSDDAGALDRRLRSLDDLAARPMPEHLRRLAATAWRLGGVEALQAVRLRAWAHTLGLRSHFLTKSRAYSTTFAALRAARQTHQRAEWLQRAGIAMPEAGVLVVAAWSYAGRGWRSRAERLLVESAAGQAGDARRLAHEQRLMGEAAS